MVKSVEVLESRFRNLLINMGYGRSHTQFSMVCERMDIVIQLVNMKDFKFKEAIQVKNNLYDYSPKRYLDRTQLYSLLQDMRNAQENDDFCIIFEDEKRYGYVGYIYYSGKGGSSIWRRNASFEPSQV